MDINFSPSATQNLTRLVGYESAPGSGSNATISEIVGFRATTDELDGAITNWYGLEVEQPNTVGTGITNAYGVYIEDQSGNTLSYGIYQASSNDVNYFAGNVGINQTAPPTANYLDITDTDDSAQKRGVNVYLPKDGSSNGKVFLGFRSNIDHTGTGNALGYYGFRSDLLLNNASATITSMYGLYAQHFTTGGTITSNYGLWTGATASGSGSITNSYGVYIDSMGGATLSFGVYQASAADTNYFAGDIGIGTTSPATSAGLEISSTTRALLVSRMNTTQRNALTAAAGMIIFNTTTSKFQGYDGSAWQDFH
jgi:hypothetical protein